MSKYHYLIVGSGLFGSVFAREAMLRGKSCLVIDRRPNIAGNIYTECISGITVHKYGAHIFHTSNDVVWEYVNKFMRFNNYINAPIARWKDELYNLPLNMNTFYAMWGVKTPAEAVAQIAKQRRNSGISDPKNLEEQAISIVGEDIYRKLIKGYTEKQWGRDCRQLPPFIIKRLPVRLTFNNNYFNDLYQGIPEEGYTALVAKMLEGTDVHLGIDYLEHRDELDSLAEKIVYTGAIDAFYDYRFGPLAYRSLRFETEVLALENYQGCAVVNYTEREIPYTRIIEHKHFVFGKQPQTVISREYPVEWKPGDEPYYPVNDEQNAALFAQYRTLADSEPRTLFGGRLGAYQYYDMDKVIEAALLTVSKEFGS